MGFQCISWVSRIQFCCMHDQLQFFWKHESVHWKEVFSPSDASEHTLGRSVTQLHACSLTQDMADTINLVVIAKTFTRANEQGRGILGGSSNCWLICLKQETMYVVGWIGTLHFFISTPSPSPTPYGRLS